MSANQTASLPVNSISQALGFADDGFPSGKPNFETVKPNANGGGRRSYQLLVLILLL